MLNKMVLTLKLLDKNEGYSEYVSLVDIAFESADKILNYDPSNERYTVFFIRTFFIRTLRLSFVKKLSTF